MLKYLQRFVRDEVALTYNHNLDITCNLSFNLLIRTNQNLTSPSFRRRLRRMKIKHATVTMITKTTATTTVIPIIWESKWTEILKISLFIRIEKHLFWLHLPIALFGRDNSMNNLSDNFCLNTMCYCLVL